MRGRLSNPRGLRSAAGRAALRRLTLIMACVVAVWGALAGTVGPEAHGQRPSQEDVEAAYLYNFGKFVRWPDAHGPLVICIAAPADFEKTVSKLVEGEQIGQRSLEVRMASRPDATAGCSILFVGALDRERINAFLAATAGKPVLTVGESPDFLDHGGMIQFVPVEDHVRFEVNLDAANRCQVMLSSELLKVAIRVTGKPEARGGKEGPR